MIRTRDFLVFGLVFVFLLTGIGATVIAQSWSAGTQVANVIQFDGAREPSVMVGATSQVDEFSREENAARLRQKIAAGQGSTPSGGPVFTSVDTEVATTAPLVTDDATTDSVLIGHTLQGSPLRSDDLWRFYGFTSTEQIGVALNDFPIYGSREDDHVLDSCGGVDEGFGYRYYLRPGIDVASGCFVSR